MWVGAETSFPISIPWAARYMFAFPYYFYRGRHYYFYQNMQNAINVRGNKKVYPPVCNHFLTIPITFTMEIFKNHTTECLEIPR